MADNSSQPILLSKEDRPYYDPSMRVDRIDGQPFTPVTIDVFGHTFEDVSPEQAADLITLEREQAIYGDFWDEVSAQFRHYRVPFTASEVFGYVEAQLAQQEFHKALQKNCKATLREALATLSNQEIARRVIGYGVSTLKDGTRMDIRGCPASFMPPGMEELVCGNRPDRYELLPRLASQADQVGTVQQILVSLPVLAAYVANRQRARPPLLVEDEYDLQDLAFLALRASFHSARREEWTPSLAGSSKRIDIVLPEAKIVVELKYIRDKRHALSVADELKVDFESYHAHPHCDHLFALIFDPGRFIIDPEPLVRDLSGLRVKSDHTFTVHVLIA